MKKNETALLVHAYLQDPWVAKEDPLSGFQDIEITDDYNLSDGPTSNRFTVVDYNGTTGTLLEPVCWDAQKKQFKNGNFVLNNQKKDTDSFQFHQLNVWAIVQKTMAFFESAQVMGRQLPWGFAGNRLIIVPHAGYGQNAYYDRQSKSLQFYYYNDPDTGKPVYTCLSADIINHELGHAILDGIRPYFNESTHPETAAFHEFFGDLTAILTLLRNNEFRTQIVDKVGPDLADMEVLTNIADQFGRTVMQQPFLRSARNTKKMADVIQNDDPHDISEVLTAAMFDIIIKLSKNYIERGIKWKEEDQVTLRSTAEHKAAKAAFWYTIYRMQRMALQPLDFLPPVDVTFRDYALAVLRAEQVSNPTDPYGYRKIMFDVFVQRGILAAEEEAVLLKNDYLFDRNNPTIYYNPSIFEITKSQATAYHFLHANRASFGIPQYRDFVVTDVYECNKQTRQGDKLPRQHVLCYVWQEEVLLTGEQYGEYAGQYLVLPCGGTLVFDDLNNLIYWANKPGTEFPGELAVTGQQRKEQLLQYFSRQVQNGAVGLQPAHSAAGILEKAMPPTSIRREGNRIHLQTMQHLNLASEPHQHSKRSWQISC